MARDSEPREWQEGSDAAWAALNVVSDQLVDLLLDREMMGSETAFAQRLRELAAAKRTGDPVMLRQATMEVSVAAAQWCAALDLRTPV